jgi:hypothetical protein
VNIVVLLVAGLTVLAAAALALLVQWGWLRADRSTREAVDDLWHENSTIYRELLWLGQQNQSLQRRVRDLEFARYGSPEPDADAADDMPRLRVADPWSGVTR